MYISPIFRCRTPYLSGKGGGLHFNLSLRDMGHVLLDFPHNPMEYFEVIEVGMLNQESSGRGNVL